MHRFVTSLTRFTNLHTPASMEQKSAKAFRSMLFIAEDNGNHLHVRPLDRSCTFVLGCRVDCLLEETSIEYAHHCITHYMHACVAGCVAGGAALHIPL